MVSIVGKKDEKSKITFIRAIGTALVALTALIYSPLNISATQPGVLTVMSHRTDSLILQSLDEAKGWKGLVPLRSTRRDVEALLGPPAPGGDSFYQTEGATIFVRYSDGPCEKGWPYGWNVDNGTVVSIVVSPKEPVMFKGLNLDQDRYRRSQDSHIHTGVRYTNHSEGITIDVDDFTGVVKSFTYHPTDSQQKLQCPDASSRLPVGRTQADSFFKFDAYGDLSPKLERERLDAVAAELLRRPETKAYLIAYAGQVAYKGEAAARAACAKDYLIKKHHIQDDKVQAIDGGHREILEVELYVEEKDGPIPLARPSVRPSKVKITQDKPVPTCRVNIEN